MVCADYVCAVEVFAEKSTTKVRQRGNQTIMLSFTLSLCNLLVYNEGEIPLGSGRLGESGVAGESPVAGGLVVFC